MRTTSAKNEEWRCLAGLFPAVSGYLDVLRTLADNGPLSGRRIGQRLGTEVSLPIRALRYRGLVLYEGGNVRLNDALPFMPQLCSLVGADAWNARSIPSNETGDTAHVGRAATLLFRTPSTAHVLIGLAEGQLAGPDLRRIGAVLRLEAERLCAADVVRRTYTNGITRYELNPGFARIEQLRDLLIAMKPHVAAERIPRHDPAARTNYGAQHHRARLRDEEVGEIVSRREGGECATALAREFGITAVYVRALCRSEYRRSVTATSSAQ